MKFWRRLRCIWRGYHQPALSRFDDGLFGVSRYGMWVLARHCSCGMESPGVTVVTAFPGQVINFDWPSKWSDLWTRTGGEPPREKL